MKRSRACEPAWPCDARGTRPRATLSACTIAARVVVAVAALLTGARALAAQAALGSASGATQAGSLAQRASTEPCAAWTPLATLPSGFQDETLPIALDFAIALSFDPAGRMYVVEKAGRVWRIDAQSKPQTPLLDISAAVADDSDFGLLGFALDPRHEHNGYVYALYQTTLEGRAVGRLSRFTLPPHASAVDRASELVLIGSTYADALPICSGHGIGTLCFGSDGSLLVSAGDAYIDVLLENACASDGVLKTKEQVGPYKSQLVDSRAGKILRVDPSTGAGLASNPFFDVSSPHAPRSQVWALGLRQPYRFALRPGSGALDPALGAPGVLFLGDVGGGAWEELDVVTAPAQNFGWPLYEGFAPQAEYAAFELANQDAPNPLADSAHPTCAPYFAFADLLVDETAGAPQWPNPCDPSASAVGAAPVHVHRRPALAWSHFDGAALVKGYTPSGEPHAFQLGAAGAPVGGASFYGACSVGGAWYSSGAFPSAYHDTYFHADYGGGWIRNFVFDAAHELVDVHAFAETTGFVVGVAVNPLDGALYYLSFTPVGKQCSLHRVRYVSGNQAPHAHASAAPSYASASAAIQLSAQGSFDPEGAALTYEWDFGPALPPSRGASPRRVLPAQDITGLGAPVSKLDLLVPPHSLGVGAEIGVIRDGVYPAQGTHLPIAQFDTTHWTDAGIDKNGEDWVGYAFDAPHRFSGLVFQEGENFGVLGGWFDVLRVQVRDASNGAWHDVQQLVSTPPYPGPLVLPDEFVHFEQYELSFQPEVGDAIRLYGAPGGWLQFVSVGELRVLASPQPTSSASAAHAWTIDLHVLDAAGAPACASIAVSTGNTPPLVQIQAPPSGATFDPAQSTLLQVAAQVQDAEQRASSLATHWQALVHHDEHVHPAVELDASSGALVVGPHAYAAGQQLYLELRCTATDPFGLSTSASRFLYPSTDCDLDGVADAQEIASSPSLDLDLDGVLDACEPDCDHDGLPDVFEIAIGLAADANSNGVPDPCEP